MTPEENAMGILTIYENKGMEEARNKMQTMIAVNNDPVMRELIAVHAIVSAMQVDLGRSKDLISLTSFAKELSKD